MEYIISDKYDGVNRKLYPWSCHCGNIIFIPKNQLVKRKTCSTTCPMRANLNSVWTVCAFCGKDKKIKASRLKEFNFCNRECKDSAQRIGGIKEIQPPHYNNGKTNYRIRALRENGEICQQCSYNDDVRMLDVDHIDSNRDNNDLENLQVLCVWCHALKTRGVPYHERELGA